MSLKTFTEASAYNLSTGKPLLLSSANSRRLIDIQELDVEIDGKSVTITFCNGGETANNPTPLRLDHSDKFRNFKGLLGLCSTVEDSLPARVVDLLRFSEISVAEIRPLFSDHDSYNNVMNKLLQSGRIKLIDSELGLYKVLNDEEVEDEESEDETGPSRRARDDSNDSEESERDPEGEQEAEDGEILE
jgi:hypothetical protein